MLLTTTPAYLYAITLLFLFTVQGFSFAQLRVSDDISPDAEFQKTDWVGERAGRLPLCRDGTCRSILRLLGSRKSCFSSCLRTGILETTVVRTPDVQGIPAVPSALTASDALAECVYARCFHGNDDDDNRIRKETIAGCISGPCISNESTGKEPEEEPEEEAGQEAEEEKAETEAGILRALRSPYKTRSLRKRGYSDATDICIQFHCANTPRGTLVYLKCIKENRCNGR